ncbi:MAG: hypothetical protein H0T92_07210 [Pyrinomonadaceae bacterium]|jgi:hypothetical protein|nr:hypothetical protein [Pyrinomonadaceae bacterium]
MVIEDVVLALPGIVSGDVPRSGAMWSLRESTRAVPYAGAVAFKLLSVCRIKGFLRKISYVR